MFEPIKGLQNLNPIACEHTIEIEIGLNKFNALCDLGASVSTIPKSVYDNFNLGPYATTQTRLNMANSTFTQAVGIKHVLLFKLMIVMS